MFVNSDFSDLLRLFNAGRVRYLVVGGYAVVQYAEPRFTADLDLYGHRLSQCPRRLRGPPGVRCAAVGIDRRRFHGTGLLLPDGSSTHAGGCAHGHSWGRVRTGMETTDGRRLRRSARTVHLTRGPHFGKAGIRPVAGAVVAPRIWERPAAMTRQSAGILRPATAGRTSSRCPGPSPAGTSPRCGRSCAGPRRRGRRRPCPRAAAGRSGRRRSPR